MSQATPNYDWAAPSQFWIVKNDARIIEKLAVEGKYIIIITLKDGFDISWKPNINTNKDIVSSKI